MTSAIASALSVAPCGPAAGIPAEEWDRLARRGFHLHRWFVAAEPAAGAPRHVAVREHGELHAIVPAFFSDVAYGGLHDRWLGPVRRIAATVGFRLNPLLLVMTPIGQTSEPLGEMESAPDDRWHRVLELFERQAADDGAKAVVLPFVDAGQVALLGCAAERGYLRVFAESTARLPVEWESFDAFVTSRSKGARRTIRAELRVLEASGVRTEVVADFRSAAFRMDALYRQAYLRRNGVDAALPTGFFERLAEAPRGDVLASLGWRGDELVAMSLNLLGAETVDGALAAYAPGIGGGPVYHNDLVYESVRLACRSAARRLDLGPTALYPKVLRGATLRPRYTLIRALGPAMRFVLSGLGPVIDRRSRRKEHRALGSIMGSSV